MLSQKNLVPLRFSLILGSRLLYIGHPVQYIAIGVCLPTSRIEVGKHWVLCLFIQYFNVFCCTLCFVGGFTWQLTEFIIGVFLQVLGLPFVAVAQVSLFSKVTAEKTQGDKSSSSSLIISPYLAHSG